MVDSRSLTVAACGASAGIHGALFAVHAAELPIHAAAFLTAALALVLVGLLVALRPDLREGPAAAAALFAALLVAYPVARHEAFDALAAISKGIELAGLLLALRVLRLRAPVPAQGLAVILAVCAAGGLMLAGGAHGH